MNKKSREMCASLSNIEKKLMQMTCAKLINK